MDKAAQWNRPPRSRLVANPIRSDQSANQQRVRVRFSDKHERSVTRLMWSDHCEDPSMKRVGTFRQAEDVVERRPGPGVRDVGALEIWPRGREPLFDGLLRARRSALALLPRDAIHSCAAALLGGTEEDAKGVAAPRTAVVDAPDRHEIAASAANGEAAGVEADSNIHAAAIHRHPHSVCVELASLDEKGRRCRPQCGNGPAEPVCNVLTK